MKAVPASMAVVFVDDRRRGLFLVQHEDSGLVAFSTRSGNRALRRALLWPRDPSLLMLNNTPLCASLYRKFMHVAASSGVVVQAAANNGLAVREPVSTLSPPGSRGYEADKRLRAFVCPVFSSAADMFML